MSETKPSIYTIGHSTRTEEEFVAALTSFGIQVLADVRRFPGSRKYPQFNVEALQTYLPKAGITYIPALELGGRRKPNPDSKNTVWRSASFRAYADYAETEEFAEAMQNLVSLATQKRVAYMCSEAVWWRCHRAIISDYLKARNWTVLHIMKEEVASEHPFTSAYLQMHPEVKREEKRR